MENRTSAPARIVAALALIGAVVIVIAVIAGSVGGGSDSPSHSKGSGAHHGKQRQHRTTAATYEVQSGDTLISIAHKTGVTVREIEELNPEIDPQILIAGEKLKLR